MSNKHLLVAVSLGLESLGHVVDHLIDQETAADREEIRGKLEGFLTKAFGVKAGEVAETHAGVGQAVPTTEGADTPAVQEAINNTAPAEPSHLDKIVALLSDERYTLRKLSTLAEETGLSEGDVIYELDNSDVRYITRVKRGNGAKLIGLLARN